MVVKVEGKYLQIDLQKSRQLNYSALGSKEDKGVYHYIKDLIELSKSYEIDNIMLQWIPIFKNSK